MDKYIKIPGRPPVCTGLTFSVQPKPGTGINAGRNFYSHLFTDPDLSGSLAVLTWMRYGLTVTVTLIACCSYSKKSLTFGNLTCTVALPAGIGMGARFAFRSLAGRADFHFF